MGAHWQDTATDAGMCYGVNVQATEAGSRWVQAVSRCTALCAGRGGGEWLQEKGAKTLNAAEGGAVGHRGERKYSENKWRQVGREG